MTLRHLSIFICVCQQGGVTAASKKLHITQPSVSQAVQELETHYGILLFERLGRRLFITDAGTRLLSYAKNLVHLNIQTEEAMRAFTKINPLRIGASITIGESVLIDILKRAAEIIPQQQIISQIHNSSMLETMLLDSKLDIALVEGSIQSNYLKKEAFMKDELIFIASPYNSLAGKKNITPSDLENQTFFLREEGSGTRQLFENTMYNAHANYKVGGIYNSAETIKKAVSANLGISVISKRAVLPELEANKLITFSIPGLIFSRSFWIVYHKDKFITSAMQTFIDSCYKVSHSQ
ncbi:LysR family transcriptional regulator [Pectinatus sottacetonis]|uniref:LysR family transcriptional regulator n=1 Tax=Pectinatus sottacetonis TaxID=1002795 RepID=UPI0018C6E88E|nr:LysR family transcriptional regulator [Pectinatus sottacetonis]